MYCIDQQVLQDCVDARLDFQATKPFPWRNIQGFLRPEIFHQLAAELPDPSLFENHIGKSRAYGQKSHDRLALQVRPGLLPKLSPRWQQFIKELYSPAYRNFWRQMLGLGPHSPVILTMHWHYAPAGASVSPHTDARRKIGSHIFYFNTPEEWDESWGGQTLVLDAQGRWPRHSAPNFEDLQEVGASQILGNRSFLFAQTSESWHGVRELTCPPGVYRKVFIVVANRLCGQVIWRRLRGKDADGYRLAG